jgi:hypothetical protein
MCGKLLEHKATGHAKEFCSARRRVYYRRASKRWESAFVDDVLAGDPEPERDFGHPIKIRSFVASSDGTYGMGQAVGVTKVPRSGKGVIRMDQGKAEVLAALMQIDLDMIKAGVQVIVKAEEVSSPFSAGDHPFTVTLPASPDIALARLMNLFILQEPHQDPHQNARVRPDGLTGLENQRHWERQYYRT